MSPSVHPDVQPAHRVAWSLALAAAPYQPEDAHAAALLGFAEAQTRHDPSLGALLTFAYPRMRGRVLDLRRSEARLWRLRQGAPAFVDVHATVAELSSGQIDVRRAVTAVQAELSSAEAIVLAQVYHGEATLRSAAQQCGRSEDQLHRAHDKLLRRLRQHLTRPTRPVIASTSTRHAN